MSLTIPQSRPQGRGLRPIFSVTPNVTVRRLVNGRYQEKVFTGNQRIISQTFPELTLTAKQVWSA